MMQLSLRGPDLGVKGRRYLDVSEQSSGQLPSTTRQIKLNQIFPLRGKRGGSLVAVVNPGLFNILLDGVAHAIGVAYQRVVRKYESTL